MNRPYQVPAFRKKLYVYTLDYDVVDKDSWFNRRKSKTQDIIASSELMARKALHYWWNEHENCVFIKSVTVTPV